MQLVGGVRSPSNASGVPSPMIRGTAFTATVKKFAMERRLSLYAIATAFEVNTSNHAPSLSSASVISDGEGEGRGRAKSVSNGGRRLERELLLWVFTPQLAFFIPIFTLVKGAELGLEPWRRNKAQGAGVNGKPSNGKGRDTDGDGAGANGAAVDGVNGGDGGGVDDFRGVGEGIIRAFWQRNSDVGADEVERLLFEGLELVK